MVDMEGLNPLKDFGLGNIGFVLLMIALGVLIVGLIGGGIFWWIRRKQLKYSIPTTKKVGDRTIKVGNYKAKDFSISKAGDKLWYIPKIKKFLPPASMQTAPNEYTHHIRADGEWINVSYPDVDEKMKEKGVKWVHQDMRANRVAIGDIIDQRFRDKKGWWEKYGHLVTHLIFYIIVMIAMVVVFYMWGDIVDRTSTLISKLDEIITEQQKGKDVVVPSLVFFSVGYHNLKNKFKNWFR